MICLTIDKPETYIETKTTSSFGWLDIMKLKLSTPEERDI